MPMIMSPRYWILQMSDGSLREVYRRESDGRLMIAYVSSPNTSMGFVSLAEIKNFYQRHFNLGVVEMVCE